MSVTVPTMEWPGWAKAILIAQLVVVLAVVVPWVLMWTICAGMAGMQMPGDMMGR